MKKPQLKITDEQIKAQQKAIDEAYKRAEPLHEDLQNSIITTESGMKMIHHRLYITHYMNHPMLIETANKVYKKKKELEKKAIAKKDMESLFWIVERAYKVPYIYEALMSWWKPNAKEYWKTLHHTYCTSESVYNDLEYWDVLFNEYHQDKKHLMMTRKERKYFKSLPEEITIYRGGVCDKGISWTINKDKAEWFANRFNNGYAVFEKKVKKSDCFAYIRDCGEDEIIYIKETDWGIKEYR